MKKLTYKSTISACYLGYITQAIVVNFMPILFAVFQDKFKISFSALGSLILLNFVTQILVDMVGARYVDKIGFRRAIVPAHIFAAAGLISLGTLPQILPSPYLGLVISVIIFSFGGGLIEVVISPVVDAIPSDDSSAAMSLLHSFYCWGQLAVVLLTTLALKILGHDSWTLLAIAWAIVPVFGIICFMHVPLPPTVLGERQPLRELFRARVFLLGMLLMTCAGAAEQTMAQWASLFAQKGLMVSKVVGDLLGPCLFALFMAVGRVFFGMKGEKLNIHKSLLISSVLCVVCYLTAVFSKNAFISLLACVLTGFTVALMWPGTLSYMSATFPQGGAAMFGVMAIFGDVGCSAGPWLAGLVSDGFQKLPETVSLAEKSGFGIEQLGLKAGIFVGIIFPILMIWGLIALGKRKNQKKPLTN